MALLSLRTLLASTAAAAAIAASANAQSGVYLLQLGSFETKQAATERWEGLRGKYPQLLDGLSVRLMDVTLPPDNFTVYRTQAGALSSRANAQSICDRLTAKGDECYVVETAMFNPDSATAAAPNPPLTTDPMAAMNATAPAPAKPASAKTELAKPAPAKQEVAAAVPSVPVPPPPAPDLPDVQAKPQAMAIGHAEPAPPPVAAPPRPPKLAQPKASSPTPAKSAKAKSKEESGFWSFIQDLDPFAEDVADQAAQKPKTSALASASPSRDIIEREDVPMMPPPAVVSSAPPAPLMGDGIPPAPASAPLAAEPSHLPSSAPVADAGVGYTVPGFDIISGASSAGAADTLPPPPLVAAPAQPPAVMAPPVAAPVASPEPVLPPPPVSAGNTVADVRVAEAVNVPLSSQQQPAAKPAFTPPMSMGTPSQQMPGAKTLWAQIGYFPDSQVALAYWDGFRAANPTFPPVRVRVTSPYVNRGGASSVSLRVGPFDRATLVADICDEVKTTNEGAALPLTCGTVSDLGTSTTQRAERRTGEQARMETIASYQLAATEMYWVQVGSFASPVDARGHWQQLRTAHKPLLDGITPNIAPPVASSAAQPLFRLRMGPYLMRHKADELCARLKSKGTQCLIAFSR